MLKRVDKKNSDSSPSLPLLVNLKFKMLRIKIPFIESPKMKMFNMKRLNIEEEVDSSLKLV